MIKSKKQMFIVIGVFTLVMLLGSVTYAFFNYTRTGTQNTIKVGRIAFNSTQNGRINLANVFPISASELENDENNHGEVIVNITGDTTYSAGMEYLLSFSDVNNILNGKKVPIKYNVTSTNLGDEASSYWTERGGNASIYHILDTDDIYDGKKVAVGYIKNGTTGINGSVKIEAYIDKDEVAITDTEDENTEWQNRRTILSTSEWNSLATTPLSFKIKVEANEGVWVRESPTPATCFATNVISEQDKTVEITGYNGGATYTINPNPTQEQINACVAYFEDSLGNYQLQEGESLQAFCDGTGTILNIHLSDFTNSLPNNAYISICSDLESIGIMIKNVDICGDEVEIPRMINGYKVVKIADGTYDSSAFLGKIISKVVIPNTVKTIGDCTFYTSTLKNVVMPNSVTTIGANAFRSTMLTNVIIPNSVITIGERAFQDDKLTSIVIPNSVTTIGEMAFSRNQLTSVVIPNSITTLKYMTFSHNKLVNVVIPNGVTTMEAMVFYSNQLTSVTIPDSVTVMYSGVFNNNKLPDNNAFIYKRNDINHDGIAEIDTTTIVSYGGTSKDVLIPNNVTTIGVSALSFNELTSVTIPNSVTTIEDRALSNNQLTSITIPNSVITIGSGVFSSNQLTSVTVGNGITSIGRNAFDKSEYINSNLSSITINKSCGDIKNTLKVGNNNYYPWLAYSSPYKSSGVTIYGANNEVCDTF